MPDAPVKPRRHLFRFGLRTMFVVVTVFSLWLGYRAHSANVQRRAVESIGKHGHVVYYHEFPYPFGTVGAFDFHAEPSGPRWVRAMIGDDYFRTVRFVSFSPDAEALAELRHLPRVEFVQIDAYRLTDKDLAPLAAVTGLTEIGIERGHALGVGCLSPLTQLSNLKQLNVKDTPLTDSAIEPLREMPWLKVIRFHNTLVTPDGVAALSALKNTNIRVTGKYQIPATPPRPQYSTNDEVSRTRRQPLGE